MYYPKTDDTIFNILLVMLITLAILRLFLGELNTAYKIAILVLNQIECIFNNNR